MEAVATLTSMNGGEQSTILLPSIHPGPAAQGTGKGTSPDAVRWAACPGAEPMGTPWRWWAFPAICFTLYLNVTFPSPPKKSALSRVKGLHLYFLHQTNKLTSVSACEPPHSSPGTPPRCRDAEQCVVNTDFCIFICREVQTVRASQAHATTASDPLFLGIHVDM